MLTPEIQLGAGSSQADAMSTNEVVIRVLDTLGVTVNGSLTIPAGTSGRMFWTQRLGSIRATRLHRFSAGSAAKPK